MIFHLKCTRFICTHKCAGNDAKEERRKKKQDKANDKIQPEIEFAMEIPNNDEGWKKRLKHMRQRQHPATSNSS